MRPWPLLIEHDHRALVCERLCPHLHRAGGHERAGNQQQWRFRPAEPAVHLVIEVQPVYRQATCDALFPYRIDLEGADNSSLMRL